MSWTRRDQCRVGGAEGWSLRDQAACRSAGRFERAVPKHAVLDPQCCVLGLWYDESASVTETDARSPGQKGSLTSEKPSSGSPADCPFLPPLRAFSPSSGAAGVPSFPTVAAASGCSGLNMAKLGGKVLRYASTWARRAVKASRSVERAIVGGRKASFAGWKTSQVQSSGRLRPASYHCASALELPVLVGVAISHFDSCRRSA